MALHDAKVSITKCLNCNEGALPWKYINRDRVNGEILNILASWHLGILAPWRLAS